MDNRPTREGIEAMWTPALVRKYPEKAFEVMTRLADLPEVPEDVQKLVERARKSYRSLDGVIVVSPSLVADLADALEAAYSKGAVRCNCGWGGEHDPDNPRCDRNQKGAVDDPR